MSHYPHSTLATSLSSSPYAVHNNLEALIQRSRAAVGSPSSHAPVGAHSRGHGTRSSLPSLPSWPHYLQHAPRPSLPTVYDAGSSAAGVTVPDDVCGTSPRPDLPHASSSSSVIMAEHDDALFPQDLELSRPRRRHDSVASVNVASVARDRERGGRRGRDDDRDAVPEPYPSRGDDRDSDDYDARPSRWPRRQYSATSEPLCGPNTAALRIGGNGTTPAGNSRSRSSGRTPPRTIMRPMTRARREAAMAAGASLSALPPIASMDDSAFSTTTDGSGVAMAPGDATPSTQGTPASSSARFGGRRGRSKDRRPITPVVRLEPLPGSDDDSSAADDADVRTALLERNGTHGVYLPGSGGPLEPLSCDPAEELDATDLGLPTDAHGHEVHSWKGALHAEVPIIAWSTLPVFLTQLTEYSLSLVSVVSIGHIGTLELAASSLANMTAAVSCFSIMQGLATALDTLLPAAWTSSDPSRVGLWTQRMSVVMTVAMIPMFVLWFNIEAILISLRQEPKVAALAAEYLKWFSIGIPGYSGTVVLKKYLQSQNIMDVPTYVLFTVAPVNLFFNWLLVWGPAPFRLGFRGGAIATAISYNLTFVLLLAYVLFFGPREAFHPFRLKSTFSRLGTVTSLGLSGTLMMTCEWWAWEVCALAAALLGSTVLAAQSVLLSTCATLYQLPAALAIATSVRVGNLLGAGRAWEAKWASRAGFILAVVFACFNSAICFIFRNNWGYLFNSDPVVVSLVASVMPWIGLFQIMDGVAGTANAILRALAMHAIGACVNITSYYILGIPFGMWLCFGRLHLGLVGIWQGLAVALFYGSIFGTTLVWRADWEKGVDRVRERLGLSTLPPDHKFADDDDSDCPYSDAEDGYGTFPNTPNGNAKDPDAKDADGNGNGDAHDAPDARTPRAQGSDADTTPRATERTRLLA